jgi:hypothetical protein
MLRKEYLTFMCKYVIPEWITQAKQKGDEQAINELEWLYDNYIESLRLMEMEA